MPRLPPATLIALCRSLRHQLGAGLSVADVFRRLAGKGSGPLQLVAARVSAALESGADLAEALAAADAGWPALFTSLVAVGEQSGMLPEVFGTLEQFFTRQQTLRRQFLSQITWPVFQFVMAIGVLTLLIWALGVLLPPARAGAPAYDPLGLGLSGPLGALTFLGGVAAFLGVLVGGYLLLTRILRAGAAVDRLLLRLPALGPCLRALALARFCLALRLTTQTGMSLRAALKLSFAATGNAAFVEQSDLADKGVRGGNDLTVALTRTGLFPDEFRAVLEVGEESGRLDEVLRQQAEHYDEEAGRRLKALAAVAGYGVWAGIGLVLIVVILRIFMSYIALLNSMGA
jgi:type IV pilus assembly protein PilC